MTLSSPERAELRRQGAKAAARGEAAASNPMDRQRNSPEATGESLDLWAKRSKAWRDGHDAQSTDPSGAGKAKVRKPNQRDDER